MREPGIALNLLQLFNLFLLCSVLCMLWYGMPLMPW